MSDNKLIKKINENTNSKQKKMSKILDIKKNYEIKFSNKIENEISINLNHKKLLNGTFNFYGIIKEDGRFYWSYMIPGVNKKIIKKINKIKSFSHLFENSDIRDLMLYHQILTQDSILLNDNEIKMLNALLLYLSEDKYIFFIKNNLNITQIISLDKITEQFY